MHPLTTVLTNKMTVQTTNIRDYIELLEAFRIGLTNGLLNKEEVIKWADNIIQQDEEPDYFVIELSLCGHKSINDIVSLINEFVGEPKPIVSGRMILGFVYRQYIRKRIPLRKVTAAMYWLNLEDHLTETEKGFMYGLDEDLDCAESGMYGTVEAVEKAAMRFIEIYKDFSIDNFDKWSEINRTIDEKVKELSVIVNAEREEIIKEHQRTTSKKVWWKFWKN